MNWIISLNYDPHLAIYFSLVIASHFTNKYLYICYTILFTELKTTVISRLLSIHISVLNSFEYYNSSKYYCFHECTMNVLFILDLWITWYCTKYGWLCTTYGMSSNWSSMLFRHKRWMHYDYTRTLWFCSRLLLSKCCTMFTSK